MYQTHKSNWIKRSLFLFAVCLLTVGFVRQPGNESSATEYMAEATVSQYQADIPTTTVETPVTEAVPIQPQSAPLISGASLKIDAIDLNIPLGRTTLGKNKELLVPADASKAAWYVNGPIPGNNGTALITGHYDSNGGVAGVFYNLEDLKAGDTIRVGRDDGKVAVFKVDSLASYRQDHTFPWNQVYSVSGPSGIRIITCDGTFNPSTGRYSHNLVVYASLVSIESV